MARMLPTNYSVKFTKSKAERKLFEMLKSCPDDWIVFHSYDISHSSEEEIHKKKMKSEIDFLVLVPNLGIAAFEVKGGNIEVDKKTYSFYSNKKVIENPFKQIEDNIRILEKKYNKQYGDYSFPYNAHGVMFPDCLFPQDAVFSYDQWKIFDKRNMQNIYSFITSFLIISRQEFEKKGFRRKPPTEYELNVLADNLIPKPNNKVITYAEWKNLIEYSQTSFKEEQLQALCNTTYAHNRCLIEGYTGTGKTFIAVETAKYSLNKEERIAFFCFNSILADWLKKQLPRLGEHSFVGRFHEFLEERIEIAGLKKDLTMSNSGKNYIDESRKIRQDQDAKVQYPKDVVGDDYHFEVKMPNIALIALEKKPVKYDKIIIDEAQDIFVENYFYVLDKILEGGIKKGKWCFFADPEQNIEKSKNKIPYNDAIKLFLGESWDDFSRPPPLTYNWRNSENIKKNIYRFMNWSDYHNISDKNKEGQNVKYISWSKSTPDDQKEKIEKCLTNLLENEKINPNDITLLTTYDPHRHRSPTWHELSVLSKIQKYKITEYKKSVSEGITFSSIASFKGMENRVIILVDVDVGSYKDKNLLYVGMSRARLRLIIFESKQAEEERNKLWKQ